MKRTAMTLIALLSTQMAWTLEARAQDPTEPGEVLAPVTGRPQPTLVLQGPRLQLSGPRVGAHRELLSGLGLSIASAGLIVLGGGMMGANQSNGAFPAGVIFSITGALVFYPAILTLLYGAGHDSALRELDGTRLDNIDRVEAHARRLERTGIGLFVGGLALMLVGTGMALGGLQGVSFDDGHADHSNPGLTWAGVALALAGDAAWFAGTLVWTYGGGVHRGVRQARGSVRASIGGVGGTF